MKALHADGGEEFISAKLKDFCEKKSITIKYVASYIHEENSIVERRWRIVVTKKDFLLINSELLLGFWVEAIDTTNYLHNRLPTKASGES